MKFLIGLICLINILITFFKWNEMKFNDFSKNEYIIQNKSFKMIDNFIDLLFSLTLFVLYFSGYINNELVFLFIPSLWLIKYFFKQYGVKNKILIKKTK